MQIVLSSCPDEPKRSATVSREGGYVGGGVADKVEGAVEARYKHGWHENTPPPPPVTTTSTTTSTTTTTSSDSSPTLTLLNKP